MNKWVVCIIALIIGMLMYHMLSNVCGCSRVVEGQGDQEVGCCVVSTDSDNNTSPSPPSSCNSTGR